MRGKPENFNRPDYSFRVALADGAAIVGDERVEIVPRRRGSPLDLIVAEPMILANSTWGGWLAACGVPGDLPQPGEPRARRQGAHGHAAGAACRHGRGAVRLGDVAAAALRRPRQPVADGRLRPPRQDRGAGRAVQANDVNLLATIADFDAAYADYNGFQAQIERYWSLHSLAQNDLHELDATVMKDGAVRADTLPLVFRAVGAEQLARGSAVRVRVGAVDLLTLDVAASVIARRDDAAAGERAAPPSDDDEARPPPDR